MKTFETYNEARAAAPAGSEIWARDSHWASNRTRWCVMSKNEADEYVAKTPLKEWIHWKTVK